MRALDFFEVRLRDGSFLAIRAAISWFTREMPDCGFDSGSVGMKTGGVACFRTFLDRAEGAI